MNWKDTIRKEISDKDIKEHLEERQRFEDEDEDWNKPRGSDNTVIRDRDDTFNPDLTEEQKKELGKVTQQLKDAFEGIDHDALLSILNPTGKKLSMTKKKFVDDMTNRMLDTLKREYRKKS